MAGGRVKRMEEEEGRRIGKRDRDEKKGRSGGWRKVRLLRI